MAPSLRADGNFLYRKNAENIQTPKNNSETLMQTIVSRKDEKHAICIYFQSESERNSRR